MRPIALTLLVALAVAGCGGSGEGGSGGYAQGLVSAMSGISQPDSLDQSSLQRLAGQYGDASDELGRLAPPTEVAGPHARMVAEMRAYAAGLGRASQLIGDATAFSAEMSRAQVHATAWTAAFEEIRAKGYATVDVTS